MALPKELISPEQTRHRQKCTLCNMKAIDLCDISEFDPAICPIEKRLKGME
jgi:hypothetical protein